jgi:hypothetical protein
MKTESISSQQQQQQQQQQFSDQQYEYGPSSSLYAPSQMRHSSALRPNATSYVPGNSGSGVRPRLIHGALDSRNSSGHDSGLSSGGASFDPEQHHMRTLGSTNNNNNNNPSLSTASPLDPLPLPEPPSVPRRKSLPSIVKTLPGNYKIDETAKSSDNLQGKETFVIENGIRKRVIQQAPTLTESGSPMPQATVMTSSSGSPTLARRVILESITGLDTPTAMYNGGGGTGGNKRVSMPTLVNVARHRQTGPSK